MGKSNYNSYCLDRETGKPIFTPDGKPDLAKGELFVSVSQILAVESTGDFLTRWVLDKFGRQDDPIGAHSAYMEQVSNLGSRLHTFMENHLMGRTEQLRIDPDMVPGVESYLAWYEKHDVKVIDVERVLFSKNLRIAGTRDSLLEVDGKRYMTDLKTGTVMSKAFVQLAAYHIMGEEMGEDTRDVDLLVLGGADSKSKVADGGEMLMHTRDSWFRGRMSLDDLKFYFGCLRQIWYFQNLKSRKFEPVIKGMDSYVDGLLKNFRDQFFTQLAGKTADTPTINKKKRSH